MAIQMQDEDGRYLPILYAEEMPHWEAARRGELVLQRCRACGYVWYPIGPVCRKCLSGEYEWTRMSGRGAVTSFVVYRRAWAKWLEPRIPYAVVQVQLEEGPRLTANLLEADPHHIWIGMPVQAAFERLTEAITLVQFRPA